MREAMSAATRGRSAAARDLLAAGADVNARGTYYGETALVLAAASGDAETVRTLVNAGADVSATCKNGVAPLMIAEALGHTEVAGVLLGAGANRDASLLPLSAYLPQAFVGSVRDGNIWSPPAAQALLSRGATIAADGESALLVAAGSGPRAGPHRTRVGASFAHFRIHNILPILLLNPASVPSVNAPLGDIARQVAVAKWTVACRVDPHRCRAADR